jgi:hypothetical protein
VRPVQAGAGQQLGFTLVEAGVHAVAIVLDLVQPLGPVWRLGYQRAKLGFNPLWQPASVHVIARRAAPAVTIIGNARRRIRIDLATRLVFVVDMTVASWRDFLRLSPGVLPDLSFARDDAHQIRLPAFAVNKLTSNIRHLTINFRVHSIQFV